MVKKIATYIMVTLMAAVFLLDILTVVLYNHYEKRYDVTPEIIFTNDVMVIFTRENGEGWFLDKGESLTFEAEQYPLENGWNGDGGQWIEYRSIRDGELSPDSYADNKRIQKFTVTAEEEGEYYIALRCAGTEPITLKEGTIN